MDTSGEAAPEVGVCFSSGNMGMREAAPESRGPSARAHRTCWWEQAGEGERGSSDALMSKLLCKLFQIMAFLLRKKTALLNHRSFQLILSIAGTAELGFGSSVVTNVGVFQHILCNFEVNWRLVISPEGVGVCDSKESLRLPLHSAAWLSQ